MQSINISLPDPLKQFVDGQIAMGRYGSTSEYVCELIRADRNCKTQEQLETLLLEGLSSPARELTEKEWGAIRQEAMTALAALRVKTSSRGMNV